MGVPCMAPVYLLILPKPPSGTAAVERKRFMVMVILVEFQPCASQNKLRINL